MNFEKQEKELRSSKLNESYKQTLKKLKTEDEQGDLLRI